MNENVKYFDAHCHLQDKRIIESVDDIVLQMRDSSVSRVICNGTSPDDWLTVKLIAKRYVEVLPAYGVHPWHLNVCDDWKDLLVEYMNTYYYSSVGECGLDKSVKTKFSYDLQKSILLDHLDVANKLNKPISVHCVGAYQLLLDILKSVELDVPIVIHSFSGSFEMMKEFNKLNVFFSFSGNITHKNSKYINLLHETPRARMLFETDSPDQLPSREMLELAGIHCLGDNVPANVTVVANFIAEKLGTCVGELAAKVESNFKKVFLM